jgi:hypothetical protein
MWEEETVSHFKAVVLQNNSPERIEEQKGKLKIIWQVF